MASEVMKDNTFSSSQTFRDLIVFFMNWWLFSIHFVRWCTSDNISNNKFLSNNSRLTLLAIKSKNRIGGA
jgi:hypothetical protein